MKFTLSAILISIYMAASASTSSVAARENKNDANTVTEVSFDRGRKSGRYDKRMNKKRKRKCHQFARQVYAG